MVWRKTAAHYGRNMENIATVQNHKFTIRGQACTYGHLRSAENPTSGIDLNNCSISQKSFFNSLFADSRKWRSFKRSLVNSTCNQREREKWQKCSIYSEMTLWKDERCGSTLYWTLDYSQTISSLHAMITMSPNKAADMNIS